jgi:hypothetical protein
MAPFIYIFNRFRNRETLRSLFEGSEFLPGNPAQRALVRGLALCRISTYLTDLNGSQFYIFVPVNGLFCLLIEHFVHFFRAVGIFKAFFGTPFSLKFRDLDIGGVHLCNFEILSRDRQPQVFLCITGAKGSHAVGHNTSVEMAKLPVMVTRVDILGMGNGSK